MARINDELLIAELVSGKSWEKAAEALGVTKFAVCKHMRLPAFRKQLRDARSKVLEQALSILAQAAVEAVSTLREIMLNGRSERLRLSAAKTILLAQVRYHETTDMQADVEELQDQVNRIETENRRAAHGFTNRN
jgi:hypothetical protein